MNYRSLTDEQILKINPDQPERLFSQDKIQVEFNHLRLKWHPDKNPSSKASDVFARIGILFEEGMKRIHSRTWTGNAEINFTTSSGKTFRFQYLTMHKFELGKMYIGSTTLMYVIDEEYSDLYDNGVQAIGALKYPHPKLKDEFPKLLPKIKLADKKTTIGSVVVLEKTSSTVLLQDVIDYVPDIKPKHVAWITSSLYNIVTFLDHIGVCHNAITPSTVFVDVDNHATFLFGGWWYSTKVGDRLKAIPGELVNILPKSLFKEKVSKTSFDRIAVKSVALKAFGDKSAGGSKLLTRKDIPSAMLSWLRMPSRLSAVEEYDGWMKALNTCFGKRKFIKFDHDISGMYH